jgi:predicted Zn-dependent protease
MIANRKKKNPARLAILLCAALISLAACSGARLAPIGQDGFQPEEDEARLWKESRELQMRFDRSGLVYEDVVVTAYVNQVALKIIPDSVTKEIKFDIKILKHPTPNAFALPHGALYIHTGMLAQMENEAQLAAVIGHEVSHIVHRHTVQSFRTAKQAAAVSSTLGVIGAPAGVYGLGVVLLGTVGALAAVSGYSQTLEAEADTEGLRLMVNAGYEPTDAVKVFENLKRYVEKAEIKEPFFFSTHPRLEERITSYQHLLDTEYRGRTGWQAKEDFMATVAPVILENAFFEMAKGRYTLAQESIENRIGLEPGNSKAHFALAELYRQRGLEGDQARAENEYDIAIDLNPQFAEPHRGIGLIYFKSKRTDLARRHFEKYLELNPGAKDRAYIEQYLGEISTGRSCP